MTDLLQLRKIAFDFDGVLALTNAGKAAIFADAMGIAEAQRSAFVARFVETGGMGRHQKIMRLWREFHGTSIDPSGADRVAAELSERAVSMVVATGLVPGIVASIVRLRERGLVPAVVSGTPTGELTTYLQALGARELFDEVLGSPTSKREHLRSLGRGSRSERLYLGDTMEDATAAADADWSFAKIGDEGPGDAVTGTRGWVVQLSHPSEIPAWLDSVEAAQ